MAILWIITGDTKLPPMLVFKGQSDSRVEKRLHNNWLVKKKYLFIVNRRHGKSDNNEQ